MPGWRWKEVLSSPLTGRYRPAKRISVGTKWQNRKEWVASPYRRRPFADEKAFDLILRLSKCWWIDGYFSPFGILNCVQSYRSFFPAFNFLPCPFHHVRRDRSSPTMLFLLPFLLGRAFDTLAIRLLHHSPRWPRSFSGYFLYISSLFCVFLFFPSFFLSVFFLALFGSCDCCVLVLRHPPFTFFFTFYFFFPSENSEERIRPYAVTFSVYYYASTWKFNDRGRWNPSAFQYYGHSSTVSTEKETLHSGLAL